MDKLNLNESLRIYIPGLCLSFLAFYILSQNLDNVNVILIPSIFIGLVFNLLLRKRHQKCFEKILLKSNYYQRWLDVIFIKLKLHNMDIKNQESQVVNDMVDFIETTFFSKRYSSSELTFFRFPKSLGIMYYNLYLVCIISIVISVCKIIYLYDDFKLMIFQLIIIPFLILFTFLFLKGSKQFFNFSINRELTYWQSIRENEVEHVKEIMQLWNEIKNLNSTNTQQGV